MINLNKNIVLYLIIALLSIGIAFAHSDEMGFADAKQIIENKVPCSQLTEDQLEHMGDYYMEQMHPGEAHELMDKMMGGEGSESLRQVHITMAKSIYCNDTSGMANYGMMGMMGNGMMSGGMMNMMGSNMMGSGGANMMGTNFGYGMMGSYGYLGFLNVLSLVLAIGLIILVYLWIIKLWREMPKKK
ncbi:hypothetical protein HYX02_06085 [Candidatus Woesearchaeota archaeon]|nr:hypothetical protein [Candidatus Woesearchaeota archaeon]